VRISLDARDVELVLQILEQRTHHSRQRWEGALAREGLDELLDHPELLRAVLEKRGLSTASPKLLFYVMVRNTLAESGLDDRDVADYVAALLAGFTTGGRAFRIARGDDKTYRYLVEMVSDLVEESSQRRQFLLRAHIGNYSLWLSGLFPDYVIARVHRKGAPGIDYYEDLGSAGYLMASESEFAGHYDLDAIYREVARGFTVIRRALNRVSDRYFFPVSPTPIDRLLRQVVDNSEVN
jgi:hypothetical protein